MDGKVSVAVDPNAVEGQRMKYWTGLSNFEHMCDPHAIAVARPMFGNADWSIYKMI